MTALDDVIRAGAMKACETLNDGSCACRISGDDDYRSVFCENRREAADAALRHLASHVTEAQVEAVARSLCATETAKHDWAYSTDAWKAYTRDARAALAAYWANVLGETK